VESLSVEDHVVPRDMPEVARVDVDVAERTDDGRPDLEQDLS
jgi:hypothetical protein